MVRRQGDWLSAKVGNELVMMSAEKGNYIGLSEVGARIWDLCDGNRSAEQIALALNEEYDADLITIQADVVRLLSELQAVKLVDIR